MSNNHYLQKAKLSRGLKIQPSYQYEHMILQEIQRQRQKQKYYSYQHSQEHFNHHQNNQNILYQQTLVQKKNQRMSSLPITFINSQFSQLRKKIDEVQLKNIEALSKIHKVFEKKKYRLSSDTSSQDQQASIQKKHMTSNKQKKTKKSSKLNNLKNNRINKLFSSDNNNNFFYESHNSQFNNNSRQKRQQFVTYSHRLKSKNDKTDKTDKHEKKQKVIKPMTPQLNKDSQRIESEIHCVYSQKINDLNKSLKIQSQKSQILYDQLNEKQAQNKELKIKVINQRRLIKYFSQSVNQFFSHYVTKRLKLIEGNLKKYDMKLKSICLITKDAQQYKKSRTLIKQTQKLRQRSNSRRSSSRKTKKQSANQTQENINNKTIMLNNSRSYKVKKESSQSHIQDKKKDKSEYKSPRLKQLNQTNFNFVKITQNYQQIIAQKTKQIKALEQNCKSLIQTKTKIYQNYTELEKQTQKLKEKLKDTEEKVSQLQKYNSQTKTILQAKQLQGQEELRLRQIIYQQEKQIKNISNKSNQNNLLRQKLSKQLLKMQSEIESYKNQNQSLKTYLKAVQIKTQKLQEDKNNIVKLNINFEIQLQNIQRKNNTLTKQIQIKDNKIQQLQKIINFSSKFNQMIKNQSILDESISLQNSFLINNPNFIQDMRKQLSQLQQKYRQKQLQVVDLNKIIQKMKVQNQKFKSQIKSFKDLQNQIRIKKSDLINKLQKSEKKKKRLNDNEQLNFTFKKLSSVQKNQMYSFGQIDQSDSNKHQQQIDLQSLSSLRETNLLLSINSLKNTGNQQQQKQLQLEDQEVLKSEKNNQNLLNSEVLSNNINSDIVIDQLYSEQDIIIEEQLFQQQQQQQDNDLRQNIRQVLQQQQNNQNQHQNQKQLKSQLQQSSKQIKKLQNQKLMLQTTLIQVNSNFLYMKEDLQKNQQSLKVFKETEVQLKKTLRFLQNKNRALGQDNAILKEQNNSLRQMIQQIEKNQTQAIEKLNCKEDKNSNKRSYENVNLSVSQFSLANTNNKSKFLLNDLINNGKQTQNLLILKQKQQQILELQNLLKITEEMQQKSLQEYKKSLSNVSNQLSKKEKRINTLIHQNQLLKGQNHKLKQKIIIFQNTYIQEFDNKNNKNQKNEQNFINNKKLEEILQENQNLIRQNQKVQTLISDCYQKLHQQEKTILELNELLKQKNQVQIQSQKLQTSVVQHKHNLLNTQKENQRNFVRSRKGSIYQQYNDKIININTNTNEDQILLNDSYQQKSVQKSRDQKQLQNHTASRLSNFSLSYQQNMSFLFQKEHEQELKQKLAKIKLQRRDHVRLFDSTAKYIHHLKDQLDKKMKKIRQLQKQVQIMKKSQLYGVKHLETNNNISIIENYQNHQQLQITDFKNSKKIIQTIIQRDCQSQNEYDRGFNKFYSQKHELQKFKKTQNQFRLLIQQNKILQNQFQILQEQLQKAEQQQNSLINIKNLYKNEVINQQKRFLRQISELKEQIEKLKRKINNNYNEVYKEENYLSKEEVSHIFNKILKKYQNVRKMLQPLIDFSDYEQDILSDQGVQALKLINNINSVQLQNFQEELRLCQNLIQPSQKVNSKNVE